MRTDMKAVLTIAGSDSSGGAGIQADLKTMTALGIYGMSVITALTAQNTTGVYGIHNVPAVFIANQLDCVFSDIRPQAVKVGMVSQIEAIEVIAAKLKEHQAANVVLDPVMISTSGSRLLAEDAIDSLGQLLLPLAVLVTPNIPEAELLAGFAIEDKTDMEDAATQIFLKYGSAVLVKGGHRISDADDVLFDGENMSWFKGRRIATENTHGTGCTLSSGIASYLAMGCTIKESVALAKEYLSNAMNTNLDLGKGPGPLNHCFNIPGKKEELCEG